MRVIALLLLWTTTAIASPSAQTVLASVQRYYAKANDLTVQFTQTVRDAKFARTTESRGKLYAAKPDRFRAEYVDERSKPLHTFLYDGKILWYLDHPNREITRQAVASSALPAAMSFLTGGAQLAATYRVSLTAPDELELVPKQASAQVQLLRLKVDLTDGHVLESDVTDPSGNVNRFAFAAQDVTTAIAGHVFAFDPKSLPSYRLNP
jgi:chaperone LolA